MKVLPSLSVLVLVVSGAIASGQDIVAKKQDDSRLARTGFDIYHVERSDGSTIHCYLSSSTKKLPLFVNVDGSGADSAFTKLDDGRINGGMAGYLASVLEGKAHVLVVEKPGLKLFDKSPKRGTVEGASKEFLENYTLEYVTRSNVEAIRAIRKLPHVTTDKLLVFGISDGGQLAAEIAASFPECTHVAPLACGGPTQVFDFVRFAARPVDGDKPGDVQARVDDIYTSWRKIQADPNSIEKFWSGHPYRRWASFCAGSTTEALLKTKAKIYVAHGTKDTSVPVESFDVLVSTLRAKGKAITAERLDGLSHSFQSEQERKEQRYDSMDGLIARIVKWWESS